MSNAAALRTVDDAWEHFTTCVTKHIRVSDETEAVTESAIMADEALAAFMRANEGVFEDHLVGRASDPRWAAGGPEALHALLQSILSWRGMGSDARGPLHATLSAFDPLKGLQLCRTMVWRHHREEWADISRFFANRFTEVPKPHHAPPELRDAVAFQKSRISPPDVLPQDLEGRTPREIEAMFEEYVGLRIGDIEARLRPGVCSFSGFLGPEDRLGEVVWEDANRLRQLGVDRRVLADRLEEVIDRAYKKQVEVIRASPGAPWRDTFSVGRPGGTPIEVIVGAESPVVLQVWRWGWLGSQSNPFHTQVVESTNSDFIIVNRSSGVDQRLQGSALASPLIRRFCFFEGRVPYRIEPVLAARVLGLVA
ncbi:MAG: hypothetical protein IPK82_38455 [Polyangiaceae bacterium]|nr:hypothetical protein [Polyangiaceae bacterium]